MLHVGENQLLVLLLVVDAELDQREQRGRKRRASQQVLDIRLDRGAVCKHLGERVRLPAAFGEAERAMLTDPQTSGGLLVACAPEACDEVLAIFKAEGFGQATIVGEIVAGPGEVTVA